MSIHGRAAWDYIPNPPRRSPFLGGGGLAVVVCTHPCGGGSPVGAPSGMAEKTRWRPLGSWAPSRKNLGFAGGDSASLVWYGMVWYGMVWYGMVWYGMIWYGMVWYGMVWYGMVWYGMLLLSLLQLRRSARAGGKHCQMRSPWAERKRAVGRRYASRAGADDDRGEGGVPPSVGGKGGARRCGRDHLPVCSMFPPPPRGEGTCTCARRRRDGRRA